MYMAYGLNQALTSGNPMPLADAVDAGPADLYMGTVEGGEPGAPAFESDAGPGPSTDGGATAMAAALSLGPAAASAGVLASGDSGGDSE